MKKLITSIFLLAIVLSLDAQEIEPSLQAQGYLDSKEATVDYSVGLFHYKIPVFALNSGDYTLPVSFDYVGRGVREGDASGILGFNWTLNTGGIISRVGRGGPDILNNLFSYTSTDTSNVHLMEAINFQIQDAEKDIFTASFNNKNINFILKRVGTSVIPTPLEQTNVKISIKEHNQVDVFAWQIIDEDGCQYIFSHPEEYRNFQYEADASNKNKFISSYISSWYLSQIIVPNQDTIYFDYMGAKELFSIQDSVFDGFTTFSKQWVSYYYGEPISEYPFDFMRHSYEFSEYMTQAANILKNDAERNYLSTFHSNIKYSMDAYTGFFTRNSMYETINDYNLQVLHYQNKVAGILTDISKATQASQELIDALNSFISTYKNANPSVAMCLDLAKRTVKNDIKFRWDVRSKIQWLNYGYSLKSPYVKSIYNAKQKICFDYTLVGSKNPFLTNLRIFENGILTSTVNVQVDGNKKILRSVEYLGSDGVVYDNVRLNYYYEGDNIKNYDSWGYYTNVRGSDAMMINETDPVYIKKFSLQNITNNLGGQLEIDYEPNMLNGNYSGGIRVKQMIIKDGINRSDTISYIYPFSGVSVYDEFSREGIMDYGKIKDRVIHSRLSGVGNCYVNTGNNGIYYSYVQEVFKGRGMNAYLFSVASPSNQNTERTYPWWLSGVLLGKAAYDKDNRLIHVQKMNYYATISLSSNFTGKSFFEEGPVGLAFNKSDGQLKPYPYFTANCYTSSNVLVYRDPLDLSDQEFYINPYASLENRQITIVPSSFKPFYQLYYGGKTVIKEQKEYLFSSVPVITGPEQIEHPENVSGGQLVNKIEYFYDNAAVSTMPTRAVENRSNGDQYITCRYTPLEFSAQTSSVIAGMQEKNILSPVLKELVLCKRAGETNYQILDGTVHEYGMFRVSGNENVYLPKKMMQRVFDRSRSLNTLPTLPIFSLYADGEYALKAEAEYVLHGNKWLPGNISSRADRKRIMYSDRDKELLHILETSDVASDVQAPVFSLLVDYYRRIYIYMNKVVPAINPNNYDGGFKSYLLSGEHQKVKDFMQNILSFVHLVNTADNVMSAQREIRNTYLRFFTEMFTIGIMSGYEIPYFTEKDFEGLKGALSFFSVATKKELNEFAEAIWSNKNQQEMREYPIYEGTALKLGVVPTGKNYRVFLYAKPTTSIVKVAYDVTINNKKSTETRTLTGIPGIGQLLSLDITLPDGVIDKLDVEIPKEAQGIVAVLIPSNTPFQAYGYDYNDRLICKFDQLRNVVGYEYDAAGRLIRGRDREGNVIKECQYNYTAKPNSIVEKIYQDPTTTTVVARSRSNTIYYDGLGRKLQEIQVGGSPDGTGDIILPHIYGAFGRVEKEYLPYTKTSNNGTYDEGAFHVSNWNLYGTEENAHVFTGISYDNSPLDRIMKKIGPGKTWHTLGKGISTSYGFNGTSEVRLYRVAADGTLVYGNTYATGALQKTVTTDEDGCRVEAFTDNTGNTVLAVSTEGNNRLETYSVLNERGLLRWVLSPEASNQSGTSVSATILQRLAYYYDYDGLGRMIEKRLPGCDPVYMVYDKKDRLVMSQDGKQRASDGKKWSYSLYDSHNRVIETGEIILSAAKTHATLQTEASSSDNYIPAGTKTVLQSTLYDTYTATSGIPILGFVATNGYATDYSRIVTGLVTSIRTRVLETGNYLTTTTYYDDRCRVIQTVSDNLQGQKSRIDIKYDFLRNVLQQRETHQVGASQTDVLETINTYDARGRLLTSSTGLNNGSPALIAYTYDAVGRLKTKSLGSVTETLSYNTRGWLTAKESTPFKMKLRYELSQGGTTACYNGNISEWEWQQGTNTALMYGFTYDGINRLTGTVQKQKNGSSWSALTESFLEKGLTYDRNGNIKTLQRTAGGVLIDNLVYMYTGNQLTGLTESVRTSLAGDIYLPGAASVGSYVFDKNGNMTSDSRKALNLTYNVLNLLSEVKTTAGILKAKYNYLADGTKLRVRDNGDVNGFDYLGSLTYKKNSAGLQLESANFGDGVIRVNDSNSGVSEVNYFLTDHLGSVRVIVNGSGVVKERNDYYPFGARHVRDDYPQLADNRNEYNGKEKQVTGNLEYLDYGARMYDCGLGRWFGVDPQAEKCINISFYTYCANNPIKYIDPNGEEIWFTFEYEDGEVISMTMHVTMKLMNMSSNSINMDYARRVIYKQLMSSYSGMVSEGVKFILDLDLTVAESMEDVKEKDHLLVLADFEERQDMQRRNDFDYTIVNGVACHIGGLVAYIDADYFSGPWDRFIGSTGERAAAHEFGHLAGLEHVRGFSFNLMKSDPGFPLYIWSKSLTSKQFGNIYKKWKENKLNLSPNHLKFLYSKKIIPYRGEADIIIKPF